MLGSLCLVLIGMGVISCKKEKINTVDSSSEPIEISPTDASSFYRGVTVENGMVRFTEISDYYSIVNDENVQTRIDFTDFAAKLDFKNYFTEENKFRDKNASQEMDNFLGQILNQGGCIQIGNHIYRIDLLNERVLVIEASEYEKMQTKLVDDNLTDGISVYSLTQDVISLVNDRNYNGERCSSVGSFDIPSTGKPGTDYEFQTRLKLFTAGIYYRVTGRTIKIGSSGVTYRYKLHVVSSTAEIRRKPCSNNEVTSHGVGLKLNTVNVDEAVWEAYSKSWNVKEIYFYIKTYAEFGDPTDDGYLLGESPTIGVNL